MFQKGFYSRMKSWKEILRIRVRLADRQQVQGKMGRAVMLGFTGTCESMAFNGKVLEGGIDTQIQLEGEPLHLSARYIMRGTDLSGRPCSIFIENNGIAAEDGRIQTKPRIFTDSDALSYLETAELRGSVSDGDQPGDVDIVIEMADSEEEQI